MNEIRKTLPCLKNIKANQNINFFNFLDDTGVVFEMQAIGVPDIVASAALERYRRLPKKGKCGTAEWTVLAAFVAVVGEENRAVVLSLATGTKCLPKEQMASHVLSDSHAEVLARRALCVRLIDLADRAIGGEKPWTDGGVWNPNIRLFLYTSKEPCGSSRVVIDEEQQNKRVKLDVGCTVRKPGRGSATNCVSCCDKISKWAALGLLSKRAHSSPPLHGLVVGGTFDSRPLLMELLQLRKCPEMVIERSLAVFEHDEKEGSRPSGLAINWIEGIADVEVTQPNGKKMGATSSQGDDVNPKHISRLAPIHRRVVHDSDYEKRKEEWKNKVGF